METGCGDWLRRLVVETGCGDWLRRLVVDTHHGFEVLVQVCRHGDGVGFVVVELWVVGASYDGCVMVREVIELVHAVRGRLDTCDSQREGGGGLVPGTPL